MNYPLISVIIPVYNAEAYLQKAVVSVLKQTYPAIEVIAVNDGSTDNSALLLNELAAGDPRLKVIHQSNSGVSAARNSGLQAVTGSYIAFCDADDWMEADMLETMYRQMQAHDVDWVICNVNMYREGRLHKTRLKLSDEVITVNEKAELVHKLMRFVYDYANWNKLYKAAVIQQQGIRFSEDMSIWEDLLFNLHYAPHVHRMAIVQKCLYNYQIVANSLYSGKTQDRIPQYNLLFKNYRRSGVGIIRDREREAFCREMAALTYNQLLWEAEIRVKETSKTPFAVIVNYMKELKKFDPALFYFPTEQLRGFQGIKKKLLVKRRFFLFSLMIAAKLFFSKPAKLIKKLMKA